MNTLPLECLVANFLACECGPEALLHEAEDVYSIPLDETHQLGVQVSASGEGLLFFAHPGPGEDSDASSQVDEELSEQLLEELELGDDIDGSWVLSSDPSTGRHTLWIRADYERIGHAEFARIIENLRWRFAVWDEVLATGNAISSDVTQGLTHSESNELHGKVFSHGAIQSLQLDQDTR
jgi:hypothetical protein